MEIIHRHEPQGRPAFKKSPDFQEEEKTDTADTADMADQQFGEEDTLESAKGDSALVDTVSI